MKQTISDKSIIWIETGLIIGMIALLTVFSIFLFAEDFSQVSNRQLFNFAAESICMLLSVAIAFGVRTSHRIYETWHFFFILSENFYL